MGLHISLPESLRPLLRKPFGVLYTGTGGDAVRSLVDDLDNPTILISVGDVTTFHLLESNIIPDILIVDDRTKRAPASSQVVYGTKHKGFTEITVDNPPGVITEDLIDVIGDAIVSDKNVRIFVQGEEDLAALPAILMAPLNSVVLYGQPDKGVMLVRVTESIKAELKDLFDKILEKQDHKEQLYNVRRKLNGY
ncbi:GTP-dependent dephospho-CoA kinase family protein [Methanococcoides seepicolus]|uniref:GTP-dependent dephospho-CoA kinase n=1 Tax=Methanococcoides seepicolus TaxID=2828780 RepID=A0A9E4ZG94_9EURY|nr:GTP-dependent dephospho-CoA kinase family protein [Methanococcoides seepicolus]MCM1987152.1 GTP-dependent dephospho-CoA kinase family protein [Methanococcoides seepicolus]